MILNDSRAMFSHSTFAAMRPGLLATKTAQQNAARPVWPGRTYPQKDRTLFVCLDKDLARVTCCLRMERALKPP
jgi:hypothetical protein